jgi:hypothetical protein
MERKGDSTVLKRGTINTQSSDLDGRLVRLILRSILYYSHLTSASSCPPVDLDAAARSELRLTDYNLQIPLPRPLREHPHGIIV